MNALDVVLLAFALVYALSGYRQGFAVGAASTAGLLLGGFVGVRVAPLILDRYATSLAVSVAALAVVLVCAFVGQAVGALLGNQFRRRLTWKPARLGDALGGSALNVAAMLVIAWVLGVAASGAQVGTLNDQIRESKVLGTVDKVLPGGADRVVSAFSALVDSSRFPSYLEPFASERIRDVPSPNPRVLRRLGVESAHESVAKVIGRAPSCERTLEGSGFVYDSQRVMTNAHVVAGVVDPQVSIDGSTYAADVVYYDSDVDVAVLSVPDLEAPVLRFSDEDASSGDAAAVLGFPENGPYDVQPARIRDRQTLRSPDIYGDSTVERDTYSIYSDVRQGNSGGPLVNRSGDVVGVIFAASLTDDDTGYALTADQVGAAAAAGVEAEQTVGTGSCAV